MPVAPLQVKNVDGRASPTDTATLAYSEKPTSPLNAPASPPGYTETDYSMDVRSR